MPHSTRKLAIVLAVAAFVAAACSSGDDRAGPSSQSKSSGRSVQDQELRVVGQELRFDAETLAAPAGEEFTIVFDNRDRGVPHNLTVYRSGPPAKDLVAATDLKPGPTTQRLTVPALEPGRYFYQCDAHPTTMTGTLMVTSRR